VALHEQHPEYGFAKHKGYPTKQHMQALAEFGVLECHRRSYAPVRKALQKQT
jgi:ribonuclease HII